METNVRALVFDSVLMSSRTCELPPQQEACLNLSHYTPPQNRSPLKYYTLSIHKYNNYAILALGFNFR